MWPTAGPSGHPSSSSAAGLATLLISTTSNPILSHTASCVIGNLYPAYASLKAVELLRVRDETYDATKWLMYWYGMVVSPLRSRTSSHPHPLAHIPTIPLHPSPSRSVYGLFCAVEMIAVPPFILRSMPYPILRLALTLWLQLPRFSGAYRVTVEYLRPFLHRYYMYIDAGVEKTKEATEAYRPLLAWLQDCGRRVPVLEWFLRLPNGARYIKDRDFDEYD